jgi:hypothetical protein
MEMKPSRLVCITGEGALENGIEALPHSFLYEGEAFDKGIEALLLVFFVGGANEN